MPVEIIYKCSCMAEEMTVLVTDRLPNDDVADWMNSVVLNCLAYHHRSISPRCSSVTCEYAKIPSTDAGVGIKPQVN